MAEIQFKDEREMFDFIANRKAQLLRDKFDPNPENKLNGLWEFAKYLYPEHFSDTKVPLKEMSDILLNCVRYSMGYEGYDKYKKVILTPFPRFKKSFLCSIMSAYFLLFNPSRSVMRNSATAKLAEKFSYDIRSMFGATDEDRKTDSLKQAVAQKLIAISPSIKLSVDKRALTAWSLETASEFSYICAGVGGQITGLGCNGLAILDDPYKDPSQYYEDNYTDKLMAWYDSVHRARMEPSMNVAEIIIMARWGEDDMVERLIENEKDFVVFSFDAFNDEGTASRCEEMFPTQKLLDRRNSAEKNGNIVLFNALYRSKINKLHNVLFAKEKLKRYKLSDIPMMEAGGGYKIIYCDMADTGEDYLACVVGLVYNGFIHVLPQTIFTQDDTSKTGPRLVSLISVTNFARMRVEANSGGKQFYETIKEMLNNLNFRPSGYIDTVRNDGNKHSRIVSMAGVILEKFKFLDDSEIEMFPEYKTFMNLFIKYKKDGSFKKDDAPDSLAGTAVLINLNYGFTCS